MFSKVVDYFIPQVYLLYVNCGTDSLDGKLHAELGSGSADVFIARQDGVNIHTKEGESCDLLTFSKHVVTLVTTLLAPFSTHCNLGCNTPKASEYTLCVYKYGMFQP